VGSREWGFSVWAHNSCGIHGNSFSSTKPTTLYGLYEKTGKFLKHGISSDPLKRYTGKYMADKILVPVLVGARKKIATLEKLLVKQMPGELNHEGWAGDLFLDEAFQIRGKTNMGIFIGAIIGGPSESERLMGVRIQSLAFARDKIQDQVVKAYDCMLDIVFHFEGSLVVPEFTGVRTATFFRNKRILQVQVAVAREMQEKQELLLFLCQLLKKSVRVGKEFFEKKKPPFSLEDHLNLIKGIESYLIAHPQIVEEMIAEGWQPIG
jgi:hypothetical protein